MIGIYQDSFKEYLAEYLGDNIKITHKNIVVRCPWCEMGKEKKHYHLWISTEVPIFHCFHAGCPASSGSITKLIRKISGNDVSDKYVDSSKIRENNKRKLTLKSNVNKHIEFDFPDLKEDVFKMKYMYMKERTKFTEYNIKSMKGLVFDIGEFISSNNIELVDKHKNLLPYLQSNFVGFITEHHTNMIFRNIDSTASFKHFKLALQPSTLMDYLKLPGYKKSNHIILAEGIFDILSEQIFDFTDNRMDTRLYAAALSDSYSSLIKSIIFYEQIFKANVTILSDRDVSLGYYRNLKKKLGYIIDNLTVYYNRTGKDFNATPVIPEKFVI